MKHSESNQIRLINLNSSPMTTVCTVLLLVYQLNKRTTIQMAEELAERHSQALMQP